MELGNKVSQNTTDIEALEGLVGATGVTDQITAAIEAALKIDGVDKYALAANLTAAIARIATLECLNHTSTQISPSLIILIRISLMLLAQPFRKLIQVLDLKLKKAENNNEVTIGFDDAVIFVFDAGNSSSHTKNI